MTKTKQKDKTLYFKHSPIDAALRPISTNIDLYVRLMDLISCSKFSHNRLRYLYFLHVALQGGQGGPQPTQKFSFGGPQCIWSRQ